MIAALLGAVLYTVSPNVLVSSSHQDRNHWEVVMGANPAHANELVACSIVEPASHEYDDYSTTAYVSHDGGATWIGRADLMKTWDPDCGYGPNGTYFVRMRRGTTQGEAFAHMSHLDVLLSRDGGKTFRTFVSHPFYDRPYFAVSPASAPCPRTLSFYAISGEVGKGPKRHTIMSAYSMPLNSHSPVFAGSIPAVPGFLGNGPEVFLQDGRVLYAYENGGLSAKKWAINVAEFDNCGSHLQGVHKIVDAGSDESIVDEAGGVPSLAQDQSTGPFHGRVYAVWPDSSSGSATIMVSHSKDDGRIWSAPATVSDNAFNGGDRSRAHLPSIVVNNRGVVGVSWYDNRDAPHGIGAQERFAVSLDGGVTFLPSIEISQGRTSFRYDSDKKFRLSTSFSAARPGGSGVSGEFGYNGRYAFQGGDTAGLVADSNGAFHALWVDNRTGLSQLWTTQVSVAGSAMRNGEADLAALTDVSKSVRFFFNNGVYDGKTRMVTVDTRIKNAGRAVLSAPFRMRITDLSSGFGDVRILDSNNGVQGRGAVLDIPAPGNGILKSGQTTAPLKLRFHIDNFSMNAFHVGNIRGLMGNMINIHAHVFAAASPSASQK